MPGGPGAVVLEMKTALCEIVMSFIVLAAAFVAVYCASSAPVVASYTKMTP